LTSSGNRADSEQVTITVTESGNHAPVLTITTLDTVVILTHTLTLEFSGQDLDQTTPVINVLNRPRNSSFTDLGGGNGRLAFTPDSAQMAVGANANGRDSVYSITLTASDGITTTSQSLRLHVYPWLLGDLNRDEAVTGTDVVLIIQAAFSGINIPDPLAIADLNRDGVLTGTDVVLLINYAFSGIPPP